MAIITGSARLVKLRQAGAPGGGKASSGRKAKAVGPWVEWDKAAMSDAIQITAQGLAASHRQDVYKFFGVPRPAIKETGR